MKDAKNYFLIYLKLFMYATSEIILLIHEKSKRNIHLIYGKFPFHLFYDFNLYNC